MKEKKLFIIMIINVIITACLVILAIIAFSQKGDGKFHCSTAVCPNCTEEYCDCYYCTDDACLTTESIKCQNNEP